MEWGVRIHNHGAEPVVIDKGEGPAAEYEAGRIAEHLAGAVLVARPSDSEPWRDA